MKCAEFKLLLNGFNLDNPNEYAKSLSTETQTQMQEHVASCSTCDKLVMATEERLSMTLRFENECMPVLLLLVSAGLTMRNETVTLLRNHSHMEITGALSAEQQEWLISHTTRYYPLSGVEKAALIHTDPHLYWLIQEINTRVFCAPTIAIAIERLKKICAREMNQPPPPIDLFGHRKK